MAAHSIYLLLINPEASRLLEQSILTPAGYQVTIFDDYETASGVIDSAPPSAVLVGTVENYARPLEAAESLLSEHPALQLIIIPDRHDPELELRALRAGAADYLAPPFNTEEVLTAVERAVQRKVRLDEWAEHEAEGIKDAPQLIWEKVLLQMSEGVIILDQEQNLVLVNRAARSMLDLGDAGIEGLPAGAALSHPELVELLSEAEAGRSELTLEDGRAYNLQFTPITGVGSVLTIFDITHLKELDRIKSDFVSAVSHDLRSPLTAILGYVELIGRAGPTTELQREFIRRVQFSVQNITSLINDLLDLGRIEAGFDTHKEAVDLDGVLAYCIESLHSKIEEKRQILELSSTGTLPPVFGNPTRLRQMAANLLGNAVKYTQDQGIIRISCHLEEGQLILRIQDNGPGIPAADQPHIFNKFYRASNVPVESSGTGLGLAIVKSIVENHQGRIWLESLPGRGTAFTVVLPVMA
jgi:signal transduction histidine kinase/CheY-like chemotaxis protein